MTAGRTSATVAAITALALGRRCDSTRAVGSAAATGTESRQLASCETLQVTGGYGYTPGVYFEEGTRN
ncbi:unnamed protein product, partial [Ectocarpus sp. 12 AP-2014]